VSGCPLCRERRGKRRCPAKHAFICPACCGSKRRVEIDCPDDCVYLGAHAGSWAGRETEKLRDGRRLAPHVRGLDEAQAQLFLTALVGLHGLRLRNQGVSDLVLLRAVEALRKTAETKSRGIVYEHAPDDLRSAALLPELRGLFEARDDQDRPASPDDRDLLSVLLALEAALQGTLAETAGPTAFLDTVSRVAAELTREARAAAAKPRLIVP
jgi:hypothetical protein